MIQFKVAGVIALFKLQKNTAEKQLFAELLLISNPQSRAPMSSETPHGYVYMLFFTLKLVSVYHQCTLVADRSL